MITFEEAVKIAKETRPNFNKYEEYKELYVFSKEDENVMSDGGYNMPFVVIKSTGKVFGYSQYAVRYPERLNDKQKISEGKY